MENYDVKFKKKFGQNFINNNHIIEQIVDVSGIDNNSLVIEVGPGGGILTKELAKKAGFVLSYEIDRSLEPELKKRISVYDNVEIKYIDFLQADVLSDIDKYSFEDVYFISNVPYYITTPIINKLIESNIKFKKIVLMVQKEVAERLCANPGSKSYGSISVFLNYYFYPKMEFIVLRDNFTPVPNVDSAVVSFSMKEKEYIKDFSFFEKIVYDSFRYKRKNLKNNLIKYNLDKVDSILKKYDLDLTCRAEDLSVEVFIDLANNLK